MQGNTLPQKTSPWPVDFQWVATFSDGSILEQFPEDGPEINFSKIHENQDVLVALSLVHWNGSLSIDVDLRTGVISLNGQLPFFPIHESEILRGVKFRYIFYRRVRQHMSLDGTQVGRETAYHIGWQTTLNGKNIKRIFSIGSDGKLGIE